MTGVDGDDLAEDRRGGGMFLSEARRDALGSVVLLAPTELIRFRRRGRIRPSNRFDPT